MDSMQLSQKVGDALKLKRYIPSGYYDGGDFIRTFNYPDFAKDMNNAWALVQAMANKGYSLFYDKNDSSISFISDMVSASSDVNSGTFCSSNQHTPAAILIAAALALGVEYD